MHSGWSIEGISLFNMKWNLRLKINVNASRIAGKVYRIEIPIGVERKFKSFQNTNRIKIETILGQIRVDNLFESA
mgnify:CR=1 FL=1